MAEDETPQLYLILPPEPDPETFPDRLARVLDARPVACLRLAPASRDADRISRLADPLRAVAHERDVALVLGEHVELSRRLGLDGVHLAGARGVRAARRTLGADAIVGAFCGASRHDGMTAGEAGADYVAFGPVAPGLGDGSLAERDLFAWWSEMIEVPVVAEGGFTPDLVAALAPVTDFLALGEEIWAREDPEAALAELLAPIGDTI